MKEVNFAVLQAAANDLNRTLDLDPKIKTVGQKREELVNNIITAAKLVEEGDSLKPGTIEVIQILTSPKTETTDESKAKKEKKTNKKADKKETKKAIKNGKEKTTKPNLPPEDEEMDEEKDEEMDEEMDEDTKKKSTKKTNKEKSEKEKKSKTKSNDGISVTTRIVELAILNPTITKAEIMTILNKENLKVSEATIITQLMGARKFMKALSNLGKTIS